MTALLLVAALAAVGAPDAATASTELDDLRAHFAIVGKTRAIERLTALMDHAPDAQSAEAAVWLGDLWRRESRDRAYAAYAHAYRLPATPYVHLLAARGLGDVAIVDGNYRRAGELYREAQRGATGVLAAELAQKRALARKLMYRRVVEWGAWLLVLVVLARFVAQGLRQRRPLRLPSELFYVIPIYLFLLAGAIGRDANVLHALALCAGVSLLLIGAAGWAQAGARRLAIDVALLLLANAALFYAVLNRMALVDNLVFTVQM